METVRIRTIPKAVEELHEKDPGTSVNKFMVRRWVKEGKIKSTKTGKTFLVNMAEIERFLAMEN